MEPTDNEDREPVCEGCGARGPTFGYEIDEDCLCPECSGRCATRREEKR